MFFINRQKQIEQGLAKYRQQVLQCIDRFDKAFCLYCQTGWNGGTLKANYAEIHAAESLADDIRCEVEVLMYSKALFPESRGDVLRLLETMDRIPNQVQGVVRKILNERIKIPASLCPQAARLAGVVCRCANVAVEASEKLFTDYTTATAFIGKVDELESEADRMLSGLIEAVFGSDLDGVDKLLLRDLFGSIESISDRAENVADCIRIIVAKRRI